MNVGTTEPSNKFSQGELLSHGKSQATVAFKELHITRITEIANFDYFKKGFRSDHFLILLVTHGQVDVSVNFHNYTLRKNSLVIASPIAIKQVLNASQASAGILMTFTLDFLSYAGVTNRTLDLLKYFGSQGNPCWHLDPDDAVVVADLMGDLFRRCKDVHVHAYGKEQLFHAFVIFLYEMAAKSGKYAAPVLNKLTRKEDLVIRFAELITKHVREQRKVKFYASLLNVTAKYLTETVKEISGKNAGQVIDDFVIVECKLLLEKPEYSISQVASILDFADPSFFGKYFKRLTGVSPKGFRSTIFI